MHNTFVKTLIGILIVLTTYSCTKDDELTFPRTYEYSHPSLDAQGVYEIKNGVVTKLVGYPGTFKIVKKILTDSLDLIVENNNKLIGEYTQFEFVTATSLKSSLLVNGSTTVTEGPCIIDGTKILIAGAGETFSFSSDFEEMYFCQEYTVVSGKTANGTKFFQSNIDICNTKDPLKVIDNLLKSSPSTKYDSIAVDFVSLVFKKK